MATSLFALFRVVAPAPAIALTFTVNNTGDAGDAAPGDGSGATAGAVCTLCAAIQEANAFAAPTTSTSTSEAGGAGPSTIVLGSALPAITSVIRIDGTTQPGFVAAPPFAPIIELNAALCGTAAVLRRVSPR